jgi:hypothetical protein
VLIVCHHNCNEDISWAVVKGRAACQAVTTSPMRSIMGTAILPGMRVFARMTPTTMARPSTAINDGWGVIQ